MFSRASVRQQRAGAARFIAADMREEVKERLSFMQFMPQTALVIGDPAGVLTAELQALGAQTNSLTPGEWHGEEPLAIAPVELILMDTSLASINDLPGALLHLRQGLQPGGLLIASIVGAGSLPRLRAAMLAAEPDRPYPRMHPQIDNHTASALLQRAGFARQVIDSHSLTVRYRQLGTLVSDLRDQGLGSVLADPAPPLSRAAMERAEAAFSSVADEEGRIPEQFELITLTAWKT